MSQCLSLLISEVSVCLSEDRNAEYEDLDYPVFRSLVRPHIVYVYPDYGQIFPNKLLYIHNFLFYESCPAGSRSRMPFCRDWARRLSGCHPSVLRLCAMRDAYTVTLTATTASHHPSVPVVSLCFPGCQHGPVSTAVSSRNSSIPCVGLRCRGARTPVPACAPRPSFRAAILNLTYE